MSDDEAIFIRLFDDLKDAIRQKYSQKELAKDKRQRVYIEACGYIQAMLDAEELIQDAFSEYHELYLESLDEDEDEDKAHNVDDDYAED